MKCPFAKCGAVWTPRVEKPVQCPRCKRVLPSKRGVGDGGGDAPARLPEYGPQDSPNTRCPHGKLNSAYCRATGGGC